MHATNCSGNGLDSTSCLLICGGIDWHYGASRLQTFRVKKSQGYSKAGESISPNRTAQSGSRRQAAPFGVLAQFDFLSELSGPPSRPLRLKSFDLWVRARAF